MKIEEKKTHKKALYLNEDQHKKWSKFITPKILRFAIGIQDMIKFIANNDITFEEIKEIRNNNKNITFENVKNIINFLDNNDITFNEIKGLRML